MSDYAGSGTNGTASTIENTKRVRDLGCDAALVVTPTTTNPLRKGCTGISRR